MVEIRTQSSCEHASNPSDSVSGHAEYDRITVIKEGVVTEIWRGDKWDEDAYKRKGGDSSYWDRHDGVK